MIDVAISIEPKFLKKISNTHFKNFIVIKLY